MKRKRTSAVLGTLSQKTSILMSPWVVCSVTDMVPYVAVGLAVVTLGARVARRNIAGRPGGSGNSGVALRLDWRQLSSFLAQKSWCLVRWGESFRGFASWRNSLAIL